MKKIWVLHGPNLNMLGQREPEKYGSQDLACLNHQLTDLGRELDCSVECFQSNSESELIDKLHSAPKAEIAAIVFNPAAFTHTSIALRDAMLAINCPFIEVHLSNIYAREPFRHHSYFSDIAIGVISGLGANGYLLALRELCRRFK
jgi:3-dehydroquinate dehydratase-2